jgi:hypothetical protein
MKTLSVLALLLGLAASASAYSHSFTNNSPVTVRFWVNYAACSNDTWYVKPGQVITWRSGLCCINDINVQGQRGTEMGAANVTIPGYKGWPEINWPFIACYNTNWAYDSSKPVRGGQYGQSAEQLFIPGDYSIKGP